MISYGTAAVYCTECGLLLEPMLCLRCSERYPSDTKFCSIDGTRLVLVSVPADFFDTVRAEAGKQIAKRLEKYATDVETDGLTDEAKDARIFAGWIREERWGQP